MRLRFHYIALGIIALVIVCFSTVGPYVERTITYRREDAALHAHPSADLAVRFGDLHFSATHNPRSYDVDRAKYLYQKAIEIDSNQPRVYLQLARTFFVTKDSTSTLVLITMQIQRHPDESPSAYYVQALVLGYLRRYEEAARAYEQYIARVPNSAPAYNDYAWVLLQGKHLSEALSATDSGLALEPENPWLLTTRSVVLYSSGHYPEARIVAAHAVESSKKITTEQWAAMYPGNDPQTISHGIETLQGANVQNLKKIDETIERGQSPQ